MRNVYLKTALGIFCLLQFISVQHANAQNCWSGLGGGAGNSYANGVWAINTYNGNLVVGGFIDSAGGVAVNNIAMWNGSSWSALGQGTNTITSQGYSASIYALAVYNNELYAGGVFDSIGGVPIGRIAKWNGTTWSAVGTGISLYASNGTDTTTTDVACMTVYNGALYVAGGFNSAGGVSVNNIAKWDGTSWSAVGAGIGGNDVVNSGVVCLAVDNGILYAGGDFQTASGISATNVASWNGTTWSAMGSGLGSDTLNHSAVTSIAIYQGQVCASVSTNDPNQGYADVFYISKWDGTSWSSIVGGPGTGLYNDGYVFSLLPFNGKLVAAGIYYVIGTDTVATSLAQWDGNTWTQLADGVDSAEYQTVANSNGHLYAGGYFPQINGTPAFNIAEYTCATSPNGINEVSTDNDVRVYPNPSNGVINISVADLQGKGTVQIYNLLGKRMLQSNLSLGKTELNLTGIAAGTYLYRITGKNAENMGSGSFIVQ